MTSGGLTVVDQPMGNITSFKYFDVKPLPYANQGQGIIGFAGPGSSSFHPPAPSWFFNLCHNKAISACRFGFAFGMSIFRVNFQCDPFIITLPNVDLLGTSGKGLISVGKLAKHLIKGKLTVVPYKGDYTVKGDVTLDNKIVAWNQSIIMDVGTDNIQG